MKPLLKRSKMPALPPENFYGGVMRWARGEYLLTDDISRLDLEVIGRLLATTYWAADRPQSVLEQAVRHSVSFGLFHGSQQVGFARANTDHATFTWICDVIIHPDHRGKGLGTWMVECVIAHPELQTRSQVLATRDAHGLYEKFGFEKAEYLKRSLKPVSNPDANSSQKSYADSED